jgi:hypothetical protein
MSRRSRQGGGEERFFFLVTVGGEERLRDSVRETREGVVAWWGWKEAGDVSTVLGLFGLGPGLDMDVCA